MINKAQLRNALRRQEFLLTYQPIIDLRDGRCSGVEVLVRWQRENGELLLPDRFLPAALKLHVIDDITDRVIDLAVAELGCLLRASPHLHIAINVPPHDISSGRILATMRRKLAGSGIRPGQVWLEVTEGSGLEMSPAVLTLSQARACGHVVAIDDFGTGYSSLRYLHEPTLPACSSLSVLVPSLPPCHSEYLRHSGLS